MIDGKLYDFTIAVDYRGEFRILEAPRGFADWLALEDHPSQDFDGIPDDRGNVYRVITRYSLWAKTIKSECFRDGVLHLPGFQVVQYEPMTLRPSGTFVTVPTEDTAP